jgi:hypothetical protein
MKKDGPSALPPRLPSEQRISFRPAFATVTADVTAVTGDGRKILLRAADVEDFRAGLRGQLLMPGAAGYEDARKIFNGMFDRRPALIARCLGAADVSRAVKSRAHTSCWWRCAAAATACRASRSATTGS